jgi:hypothetical protein
MVDVMVVGGFFGGFGSKFFMHKVTVGPKKFFKKYIFY